jgi:hypothetical protein
MVKRMMDDKTVSPCQYCLMLPATGNMSCCHTVDVRRQNKELQDEIDSLQELLLWAYDKIPEGYSVLRGRILQAVGEEGCLSCGRICGQACD